MVIDVQVLSSSHIAFLMSLTVITAASASVLHSCVTEIAFAFPAVEVILLAIFVVGIGFRCSGPSLVICGWYGMCPIDRLASIFHNGC